MDPSGNYLDLAMYELGAAFRKMKEDGKTFAEIRESAYSVASAMSEFVTTVLNIEDPDYNLER